MSGAGEKGGWRTKKYAFYALVIVGLSLNTLYTVRWMRGYPDLERTTNADVDLGATHARLRYAMIEVRKDGWWLLLSPDPLECADPDEVVEEQQVDDKPDPSTDGAFPTGTAKLTTPLASGRLAFSFGGATMSCAGESWSNSTWQVDEQTLDVVRGRVSIDVQADVGVTKSGCEPRMHYRVKGGGSFTAPICRTRWQRLKAKFGK